MSNFCLRLFRLLSLFIFSMFCVTGEALAQRELELFLNFGNLQIQEFARDLQRERDQQAQSAQQAAAYSMMMAQSSCSRSQYSSAGELPDLIVITSSKPLASAVSDFLSCQLDPWDQGATVKDVSGNVIGLLTAVLSDRQSLERKYWLVYKPSEWVAFAFEDASVSSEAKAVVVHDGASEISLSTVLPTYSMVHDGIASLGLIRAISTAGLSAEGLDTVLMAAIGGWGLVPSDRVLINITSVPDQSQISIGAVPYGNTSISGWLRRSAINDIFVTSNGYSPCSVGAGAVLSESPASIEFVCNLSPTEAAPGN